MGIGLIAKKIGMTQLFDAEGVNIPVTVLKVEKCTVVSLKNESKDGYCAVVLGVVTNSEKNINKPQLGYFKKNGLGLYKFLKEFRVEVDYICNIGDVFGVEQIKPGQFVDVSGQTQGKGFAGAMKRHGFGGLRASHGVSISHRCHGSTGNRTLPGRVFKGKKMAGQMGANKMTILNLFVQSVDEEKGLLFVRGAVVGAKGSVVIVRDAIKKIKKII